ncbi:MAG: isoprenylcysteine carboxylmethyltransferase family protein [Gammaproteobacteria bacterium]|nr:isoprenylcysteine carboxylmethyltransferase family protein [Gammaproteobacteria bacterium]MYE50107.1 isoprenylcysteine carboxylmethyltransferase family protein [Gammaproteobacteria bacterium]MYF49280.1 isoprenylcysteine carboxylmethyltransferase family protein [Gammaproteobacteria bacterium]MYH14363.1 isoprenylcysteine carboxylmethyltransferase family protein [Gammaproteobacteria bacterium]MYK84536.1 isoprenylcysteine carboxylmethyltransferase family protein [Gammaproteobacteria bacterium]
MFKKGTRGRAVLGSFVFFLAAPAVIAGAIPFALVGWTMELPLLGLPGERLVGIVAVGAGLVGLLDCFARFALEGRGTPSPVEQTEVLVVSGLYRFVRNPMYVCVLAMVAGQALLFGKAWLLPYAGVLLIAFHLFVTFYEEPNLRRRFGTSYENYCLHVRRWRPRLRPWQGTAS